MLYLTYRLNTISALAVSSVSLNPSRIESARKSGSPANNCSSLPSGNSKLGDSVWLGACSAKQPRGPVVGSWKLHLELAADCGRMTSNPEVMPRMDSQRRWPEVGFAEIIHRSPPSPFLDRFRIATTLIRCGSNEVPELDVAGRGEGVTLPVLSSANENRRTCEACRCERAGCSLLRTAPPDAYPTPNARGISHLQRTRP